MPGASVTPAAAPTRSMDRLMLKEPHREHQCLPCAQVLAAYLFYSVQFAASRVWLQDSRARELGILVP